MKVFFSGSKRISEPGVTVLGILDGLMRSGEEIINPYVLFVLGSSLPSLSMAFVS